MRKISFVIILIFLSGCGLFPKRHMYTEDQLTPERTPYDAEDFTKDRIAIDIFLDHLRSLGEDPLGCIEPKRVQDSRKWLIVQKIENKKITLIELSKKVVLEWGPLEERLNSVSLSTKDIPIDFCEPWNVELRDKRKKANDFLDAYNAAVEEQEIRSSTSTSEGNNSSNFSTFMGILGAASAIRESRGTNCRSNRVGNTVYTNCN